MAINFLTPLEGARVSSLFNICARPCGTRVLKVVMNVVNTSLHRRKSFNIKWASGRLC